MLSIFCPTRIWRVRFDSTSSGFRVAIVNALGSLRGHWGHAGACQRRPLTLLTPRNCNGRAGADTNISVFYLQHRSGLWKSSFWGFFLKILDSGTCFRYAALHVCIRSNGVGGDRRAARRASGVPQACSDMSPVLLNTPQCNRTGYSLSGAPGSHPSPSNPGRTKN